MNTTLPIPTLTPYSSDTTHVMTLEELVDICCKFRPDIAAEKEDSSLCVTPLIERLLVDGEEKTLKLINGQWGAHNVRVSSPSQRSIKSGQVNTDRPSKHRMDGHSEEEQLSRGIRYYCSKGQAFKIYSDAGVTGEYPNNDPALIDRLHSKKAARYRKIYTRTLMDETSLLRRSPENIASMQAYLEYRTAKIMQGAVGDDQLYAPLGEGMEERSKRSLRCKRTKHAFHRQGFTQEWEDINHGHIHTVTASDRSRLCRDADLETAFLQLLAERGTRLVGLVEDLSFLDVSDPVKKGICYLVASMNEYKLEETASNCFRGFIQLLESGFPHCRVPWWLQRDKSGHAEIIAGYDVIVRRIVDLYLQGLGVAAICSKLYVEGVRIDGKRLTHSQVSYMFKSDSIAGIQWHFGLPWNVLPVIIADKHIVDELRAKRGVAHSQKCNVNHIKTWANHLFTNLLFCSCGARLDYSCATQNSLPDCKGHYLCSKPHKRLNKEPRHGWIREEILEEFVSELFRHNPHLLTGEFAGITGEKVNARAARRALLEEHLHTATEAYRVKEAEAKTKAEDVARTLGLSPTSTRFRSTITELTSGLMEEEAARLDTIKYELASLNAEISQDNRTAKLAATVVELEGWDNLDVLTRNRLLRAVFERITVFPIEQGGHLEITLAGMETPLPLVKMRRLARRQIKCPTVAEWVADTFAPPSDGPVVWLTARNMQCFIWYVRTIKEDSAVGRLAEWARQDKTFSKSYVKEKVKNYLETRGVEEELVAALDEAWVRYLEHARQRYLERERQRYLERERQRNTPV